MAELDKKKREKGSNYCNKKIELLVYYTKI